MVQKKLIRLMSIMTIVSVLFSGCSGKNKGSAEESTGPAVSESQQVSEQHKAEKAEKDYKSPIDFKELQKQNPDIYAWIKIPGTEIDYPILQSPDDSAYYLKHDKNKKPDRDGAIFTEHEYTSKDFSDPVTVVYGHNMRKKMFGRMQELYSDFEKMKELSEIIVYLPEKEIHYSVFAAVPYDNRHILGNYDFHDKQILKLFIDQIVSIRSIGANIIPENVPEQDDKILILSTCLMGDIQQRYLVCAKAV